MRRFTFVLNKIFDLPIRYKLMIFILLPVFLVLLISGVNRMQQTENDIFRFHINLEEQIERDVMLSMEIIDNYFHLGEKHYTPFLKSAIDTLSLEVVSKSEKIDDEYLLSLKKKYNDEIDFHIISEGIIISTSNSALHNVNLYETEKRRERLLEIIESNEIYTTGFDVEPLSNKYNLWVYQGVSKTNIVSAVSLSSRSIEEFLSGTDVDALLQKIKESNKQIYSIDMFDISGVKISGKGSIKETIPPELLDEIISNKKINRWDGKNGRMSKYYFITPVNHEIHSNDKGKFLKFTYSVSVITDVAHKSLFELAMVLAITTIVIIVSVAVVSSKITRPINDLICAVERLSINDYSTSVKIKSNDEIGILARQFNIMIEAIRFNNLNLENLINLRTNELSHEKEKSEMLLLNILPLKIADRLKASDDIIADHYDNVAVVFVDVVGFSTYSNKTEPQVVVTFLNSLFQILDNLNDKYGLEKIKTIGDAYMAAGGVPEVHSNYAENTARFCIDALKELYRFNSENNVSFDIRIGFHIGSLIAGIIGKKKFIYDLWGDTVNVASRMESHGIPGKIQVTEAVKICLEEKFIFEEREIIKIKNIGEMKTYFLTGEK